MTLHDANSSSLPLSDEQATKLQQCEKFIQMHRERHPGRECLQSFGNYPVGGDRVAHTDFNLFTVENEDFVALFANDSDGYAACRMLPGGNQIQRFSEPVVWEIKRGNVKRPQSASWDVSYGMYIDPGDREYTFLFRDFTAKEWNKMVLGTIEAKW
jgi:hypothetical protein